MISALMRDAQRLLGAPTAQAAMKVGPTPARAGRLTAAPELRQTHVLFMVVFKPPSSWPFVIAL